MYFYTKNICTKANMYVRTKQKKGVLFIFYKDIFLCIATQTIMVYICDIRREKK